MGVDESRFITLASNENPLGMPDGACCAIETLAKYKDAQYPDPEAFGLKRSIEQMFLVPQSWIAVGNGSSELIELAARAFVDQGESVVVSQYAYSAYLLAVAAVNARPIIVPARGYGNDLDAMLEAIEPDTKLVFVANPNNPTGTFSMPHEIQGFIERIPDDIVVVLDEAYSEYLTDEQQTNVAALVARHRNLIVVRTFSKAYGLAGLRIGFAIAQEHLCELLNKMRLAYNTSAHAQAAATAALADREFMNRTRKENLAGREQLCRAFDQMNLEYVPSHGNFVLVNVADSRKVFAELLQQGIIVRPVADYGLPEWIRVSVGLKEQNARFIDALGAILEHRTILAAERAREE